MNQITESKIRKFYRLPILWIAVIVFLPLILAVILYSVKENVQFKTLNYGELLKEDLMLKELPIKWISTKPNQNRNRKQWILLKVATMKSQNEIEKSLDDMERIRAAIGKESKLLELAVIINSNQVSNFQSQIRSHYHLGLWESEVVSKKLQEGHAYLVDQEGRFVINYSDGWDRKRVYKDIKRLLYVANLGS